MVRTVTDDDIGIKVLYEPLPGARDAGSAPSVDIVAIHGIGTHPDDTWCKKVDVGRPEEHYVNWLMDIHMLPTVVPNARIMRYGYESQWFGEEAISRKASTVAQRLLLNLKQACSLRPLIFIAHCFGGLVVLRAIVDANRFHSKWPGIFKSTTGMAFFGTPFWGAGGLNQSEMLQAAQSQYEEGQVQGAILNIPPPDNESLTDLMTSFFETRQERNKAHVACFFEQKPSNVGAILRGSRIQKFVVDESSGCLDQSESTEKYSLSRDHFNMNKFGRPEEEDFQTVCEVIEKMVEESPQLIKARDQEHRAIGHDDFRVQFHLTGLPVAGNFVDRDTEMQQIEHSLLPSGSQDGRKIHVLHGLGGIGKTQLAIAYARKHQEVYSAILWVNGNSKDTLLQSLAAFATYARIDGIQQSTVGPTRHGQETAEKADAVLRWLALERNRQWLVVFDSIDRDYYAEAEDSLAYDIESFLPAADHGSMLITTRLAHLKELGNETKVSRVDSEQALRILMNNSLLPQSTPEMSSLVTRLGGLPLAIVQAGRYMRETGTSCQKYLWLYNTSWSEPQADIPRLRDYKNGSIQTTWSISYECVKQIDPAAAKLLQLWAYLDNQDLWFELLERGSRGSKDPVWLQDLVRSEIGFRKTIKKLLAYSLIESHQDTESYSIHPVVHDWCRESISRGKFELMMLATMTVGFAAPGQTEPEYWLMQQRLLPHANQCIQQLSTIKAFGATENQDIDDALHNLGLLYADQGKMIEAEKMYDRALKGYEKAWGPEHTSTLDTVNNLGNLYANQGKMIEAEKMYDRALKGKEKAWGPEHTSTLGTVNNLGLLYAAQGKMAEAEKMYQRALAGYEKAWGPKHTSTLKTVNNLGNLYLDQGMMREAEDMYLRALIGKEKAWGPEHTLTLNTVNNLGNLYKSQGKMKEAEAMYLRALTGYEKAWGPEHTSTLDTVNNLGNLYKDQGKMKEAEDMYLRALIGKEKAWGPEHTSTLNTINNLGNLYSDQGKMKEAEAMYLRALAGKEKAWVSELTRMKDFSSHGQRVTSGSDDHTVRLWDLQIGVSTAAKHEAGWEEDSESLSDLSEVSSVQSLPSLVSDSSSASMRDKYGSKAAEHFAALLSEDSGFTSMYEAAVAKFSRERFHKNHDQLLKTFFKDLRSETRNAVQLATVRGLRSRDRRHEITLLIHNNFEPLNVNKQQAMIILGGQEPNGKQLLDDYLAERTSALQTDSKMNLLNNLEQNRVTNLEHDDESGDEANSNSSDDDDDQQLDLDDEETYPHLEPLEIFITRGNAFARFKTNFGYLLSPPTNFSQALESRDLHVVQRFLARNFASVATSDYEWLHELDEAGYSMREIAELLLEGISDSPWIYFTPQMRVRHRIQTTFHVPGCAHQASSNTRPQSFLCSEDVHSRSPSLYTDVRRQVEELCGIGGVVPSSRDVSAWYGSVTFEDQYSLSVITYAAASTVARQSRNDLVVKISNVLANFCAAAAAVQSTGLCCDSFTFLLRVQDCLELRRIEVHHAVKMKFYIKQMLQDDNTESAVRQCVQRAESILQELRVTIPETTPNADLHYCALAAQFLCTAFLSYIQAHVGSVDPFFLDTPQRKMVLLGSQRVPGNFAISAELVELTCLADITKQMVLAFSSGATSREVPLEKGIFRYDVLANAEDFLDTWGPGYFIHSKANPRKIHAIAIDDGFVTLVDSKTSRFHWAKGALPESALQVAFEPYSMMRIGAAVIINNDCCIDEAAYRKSSFCALEPLGTHKAFWEPQERQLGFQGGQYLIGTYCQTWKRIPGTTLKQSNLQQDDWRLIDFLEQSWGLQVSFCTSVARRVSLRELVADLLPIFVNPLKQDVWRELINAHQIIQAFTQGNLFDWLRTLSLFHQEFVFTLVRTILEQLKHTGLDRRNTNLVIAWPQEGDTGRGLKIPCKAQTCWAHVIADAEDCATFAYVTPKCLETNHLKCRGSLRAWQNASKMLVTEISLSRPQGQHLAPTNAATTTTPAPVTTTKATATTQWGLEDKKTYYIQKIDSRLRVKVERPSPESNDVAHLVVASSIVPQGKWKRLLLREEEKKENHWIRERQAMGDRAECVVVRAG